MRNIVKQNKQFLLAFFGVLFIMLSCSIFVSNSNIAPGTVTIQSITPVYDEEGTYSVGNTGVIFNDKEQVVKYNVVVQNNENYDVKVTDLQLGTKSQEFLKYEVENVELEEVIKPGETKELVISFETVKMDGWGRNFNDELVTTLVFDRVLINPEPSVPNNNQNNEVPKVETVPDNSGNVVVQPEVNEPVIEEPKEEINNEVVTTPEEDANHELGMNQEIIVKDSNTGDLFVIFCFGAAVGVLGIGLVMVNKNKFVKYMVVFIVIGSSVRLASANEVFSLEIPINVSYESQNVMKPSGCVYDDYYDYVTGCSYFWEKNYYVNNIYIQNEIEEINSYDYVYDVSNSGNGRVMAYLVDNELGEYDLYIQADGVIYPNEDMSYYFANMGLNSLVNLDGLDTSNVTNMSCLFCASSIYEMSLLDLTSFNTSSVTDMSDMFKYTLNCSSLKIDMSNWDVANVLNMNSMFFRLGWASNSGSLELDLSNFNTKSVTDMSGMFYATGSNDENFTLDVSSFDTSNVLYMVGMFESTGYKSKVFTLDLSNFDTSNVTTMSSMFYETGYNSSNFTLDLSNFDTSNVTNMSGMFNDTGHNASNFTLDVSSFDTSNVTNMRNMFSGTGYSNPDFTLDVSNFDTSNVGDMSGMFFETGYSNPNFTLDVRNFDTSNVTDMSRMFFETGYNSSNFTLDLSNFDTSNVSYMGGMFYGTGYNNPNFTLDLSSFDTSNVTSMNDMFYETGYNSSKFTLDLSNFDTSKVTNMSKMFYGTGSNSDILNIVINLTMKPIKSSYNYSSVFTNTALKPGSKITVNYTEENSNFVDILISSKTNGANIVKGELIRDVISFTIEDVLYKAYEGMTWEEWVDSEFNTNGFYLSDNRAWLETDGRSKSISYVDEYGPYYDDEIVADYNYVLREMES